MAILKVTSSFILFTTLSWTTVFCLLADEDMRSGIISVPCNFTASQGRSCLNCNTRLICKSIGGLVKPCRSLDKPHCVDGRCNAHPSNKCAVNASMEANETTANTRDDTAITETTSEGSSTTSSNFENNTTEGGTTDGGTSDGGITEDTSDESASDETSRGTTEEITTTESVSDDITDADDMVETTENDE